MQEQLDRHLSLARLYYELTDDLMDGYLSLSAHRLNQIMQTLTIVTVIFVPITFMAGIYGMNFEFMPELGFRSGVLLPARRDADGGRDDPSRVLSPRLARRPPTPALNIRPDQRKRAGRTIQLRGAPERSAAALSQTRSSTSSTNS